MPPGPPIRELLPLPIQYYHQDSLPEWRWETDTLWEWIPCDSSLDQRAGLMPITYACHALSPEKWKTLGKGVHWLQEQRPTRDTIYSSNLFEYPGLFQVRIKGQDGFIGYLEELLGVPFLLPPLELKQGHQTSLGIGTDCAELAVYARQRMGYKVPYWGPSGILPWLMPTDKLESGTILHFGFQVSILYEDKGIRGRLDPEDLLIQAYEQKVRIVSFAQSGLVRYPCQWMRFK